MSPPRKVKGQVPFELYLSRLLEITDKSQRQIAEECGYPNPNVISMFKKGHMKVPLERTPAMAKALGVDPADMLRRAMRETMPKVLQAIEDVMGDILTTNERKILDVIRSASKGSDPAPDRETEKALKVMFKA